MELTPYFTPCFDAGYTPNYIKANYLNFIRNLLTMRCDCGNSGYDLDKQSSGYLKMGGYFNIRRSVEKQNFFHFGLFMNHSIIHEDGYLTVQNVQTFLPTTTPVDQTLYIMVLSTSTGYEFSIAPRLKSHIDFQLSFPGNNYKDLYEYRNYIPGMG